LTHVLHLRDTDRVCGPGKTILETAKAIDRSEFCLSMAAFVGRARDNEYLQAARAQGLSAHCLTERAPWDLRSVTEIARLVRKHRVDILHSHEYKTDILAALVSHLVPVKTMSTVHGWINNSLKSTLYLKLAVRALSGFDRVVAVSEATKRRIVAAGVPANLTVTIHNAIVVKDYDPADVAAGQFRSRLGISPQATVIGSVGRLSPEKGQADLIRAVALLANRHPDLHVVFVGDGPDHARLAALAEDLGVRGAVTFVSHMRDVRPVYRDIDLLALTSYTEGFPNVILESLCMDTPVLATAVGGVPEILVDGDTGIVVEPGDVAGIAEGLRRAVDDPSLGTGLAARGKAVVMARFEFAERTRCEAAVYRELMAKG
jgi:glycosyltransferase involved in cell wall biosynthesis